MKFGTDGVRGEFGTAPITPEIVMKLGWAVGTVLKQSSESERSKAIIGKDTRISGYILESALEAGFASAGVDVALVGPMPTPGIAYLTQTARADIGVVVSASHNGYQDNGIKFFSRQGFKLNDDLIAKVEAKMKEPLRPVKPSELGKATRFEDATGRYIEFCKHTLPYRINLEGFRVALDCANGASYSIGPQVFEELGATVFTIGDEPDGFNINQNCGSTSLEALQALVKKTNANIGIALDGDGDRALLIDEKGAVIDGDQILYVLANFLQAKELLEGGVVGTLMSNLGLERSLEAKNIPFARANVGDRYVLELLQERKWLLGGEASGHIICLDHNTTGDGIVAALQVLRAMRSSQSTLSELAAGMVKYPMRMVNVRVARDRGADIVAAPAVMSAVKEWEDKLGDQGRILLRPSGTEPLVRVMVEASEEHYVDDVLAALVPVVEAASERI